MSLQGWVTRSNPRWQIQYWLDFLMISEPLTTHAHRPSRLPTGRAIPRDNNRNQSLKEESPLRSASGQQRPPSSSSR